jgi:hypothetical protein
VASVKWINPVSLRSIAHISSLAQTAVLVFINSGKYEESNYKPPLAIAWIDKANLK